MTRLNVLSEKLKVSLEVFGCPDMLSVNQKKKS